MKAKTTSAPKPNGTINERGRRVRVGFDDKGIKRPMAIVEAVAGRLTARDKHLLRLFLLGQAPKSMPERLMVIAEQALSMTPVMTTTNAA